MSGLSAAKSSVAEFERICANPPSGTAGLRPSHWPALLSQPKGPNAGVPGTYDQPLGTRLLKNLSSGSLFVMTDSLGPTRGHTALPTGFKGVGRVGFWMLGATCMCAFSFVQGHQVAVAQYGGGLAGLKATGSILGRLGRRG
jgi:hypothetical protein